MAAAPLPFRADIEGLRAIAIVLVVLAHAGVPGFAGGFVGVDVFFVLSGYLITRILAQADHPGLVDFYAARFRRLLPALLVMLGGTALLAMLLLAPVEQGTQARLAAAASLWLSNFWLAANGLDYFAAGADSHLFQHTWSLAVEEQFYLVWPLLLIGGTQAARVRDLRRRVLTLAVLLVASLAFCVWQTAQSPVPAYYLMPARFWQFALGGLVALVLAPRALALSGPRADGLAAGALLLLLACVVTFGHGQAYPGWRALGPSLATAALLAAGCSGAGHVVRALGSAPMQWLGRRSYGWYLWHWPLGLLGASLVSTPGTGLALLCSLLALLLAAASLRWIEHPLRTAPWLRTRPVLTLLAGLGLMATAWLAAGAWERAADRWQLDPAQRPYLRVTADLPRPYRDGCDDFNRGFRTPCIFGDPAAPRTLAVIGDSVTQQWYPAIERAFLPRGWRVVVLTRSSCALLGAGPSATRDAGCRAWNDAALAHIQALQPDLVIAGASRLDGMAGEAGSDLDRQRVERLAASSPRVLLLAPTPVLDFDAPACLARAQWRPAWLNARSDCEHAWHEDPARSSALQALAQVAERTAVLDLNDRVCPQGRCRAERQGLIVYRDRLHLSAGFAASLAGAFDAEARASPPR